MQSYLSSLLTVILVGSSLTVATAADLSCKDDIGEELCKKLEAGCTNDALRYSPLSWACAKTCNLCGVELDWSKKPEGDHTPGCHDVIPLDGCSILAKAGLCGMRDLPQWDVQEYMTGSCPKTCGKCK